MSNHYAVEIYLNGNTYTDATYGLVDGVFRYVTDRPQYDSTVVPTYGPMEIDVVGDDVSGTDNTNVYYQDFLTEDWCSGNAIRANDFANTLGYDQEGSFSFKIRGDNQFGKYFWDFCNTNSIILSNAIVRKWIIIDDIFYSQWRGIVSSTTYTDLDFTFDCVDEGTTLHKVLPPDTLSISTTATANDSESTEQVTIPIVFGNVPKSPVIKLSDQNIFESYYTSVVKLNTSLSNLLSTSVMSLTVAVGSISNIALTSATNLRTGQTIIIYYNASNFMSAVVTGVSRSPGNPDTIEVTVNIITGSGTYSSWNIYLGETYQDVTLIAATDYQTPAAPLINNAHFLTLYSPAPNFKYSFQNSEFLCIDKVFEADELIGKYLVIVSGDKADTEQIYRITANNASIDVSGSYPVDSPLWTTVVYFAEGLLMEDKSLVSSTVFNSLYNYALPDQANINTWWFRISDYEIATEISTINYDGGPYNLPAVVYGAQAQYKKDVKGKTSHIIQLFEYDSNAKNYIDISDLVSVNSSVTSVGLISNTATVDGMVQKTKDTGLQPMFFGMRYNSTGSPIDNTDPTPDYSANLLVNSTGDVINNQIQSSTKHWLDLSSVGLEFYYIVVRYDVKALPDTYDRLMFLVDFRLKIAGAGDINWYEMGPLQYALFDSSGRLINLGATYSSGPWYKSGDKYLPSPNVTPYPYYISDVTSPVDWHFLPTSYYVTLTPGYAHSLFLAPSTYDTAGTYPFVNLYDFDCPGPNTNSMNMSKDDLLKNFVSFVECYIPIRATLSDGHVGIAVWKSLSVMIKQAALIGVMSVDTIKGDLYVKAQGEATDITGDYQLDGVFYCSTFADLYAMLYPLTTGQVFCSTDGSDTQDGALATAKGAPLEIGDCFTIITSPPTAYSVYFDFWSTQTHNNQGQYLTNSVFASLMHILEDYDRIPHKMIDYGVITDTFYLASTRDYLNGWLVGRTLTNQKNSSDYLTELCNQGFMGMFQNRHGQRALRAFDQSITTPNGTLGKTSLHDATLIIDGSISDFSKTDWNQTYNSFNIQYSYDYGSKEFLKSLSILHVDDILGFPTQSRDSAVGVSVSPSGQTLAGLVSSSGLVANNVFYTNDGSDTTGGDLLAAKHAYFPSNALDTDDCFYYVGGTTIYYYGPDPYNRDWNTYVSGTDVPYLIAKGMWTQCYNQYVQNKSVKLASSDVSELMWYIDSVDYDPTNNVSVGYSSAAGNLLNLMVGTLGQHTVPGWIITQKDTVIYSIPINENTYNTEIFDCILFNDAIYTNGVSRTGWISSIETDVENDQFIIRTILLPVGQ